MPAGRAVLPRVFILPSVFSFWLLFLLTQLIAYDMEVNAC